MRLTHNSAVLRGALRYICIVLTVLALANVSCGTRRIETVPESFVTAPFVPYEAMADTTSNITDMENSAGGLPDWLNAYLKGSAAGSTQQGEQDIEALPEYNGLYCFVMEAECRSLDILTRLRESFNLSRNFPQMASLKIFKTLTSGIVIAPDVLYGSGFLKLIRLSSVSNWVNAKYEDSYWIYTTSHGNANAQNSGSGENTGGGHGNSETVYKMYFFVTIPKRDFLLQLKNIVSTIKFDKTDTPNQIAAFQRACAEAESGE